MTTAIKKMKMTRISVVITVQENLNIPGNTL